MVSTRVGNSCGRPGSLSKPSENLRVPQISLSPQEEEERQRLRRLLTLFWDGGSRQERGFGWEGGDGPGWGSLSSPGAVPGSGRTSPSPAPELPAAIYIYLYLCL